MKCEKLVSIILPVYNGEKYLSESINSIIYQTYSNWELIVIDDCSTDSSASIIHSFMEQDIRIKYFKNNENLKLPRSLNRGFSLAKGDFLTWTSDDNIYHKSAIEKMVNKMCSSKVDFVYSSCSIIDDNNKVVDYIYADDKSLHRLKGKDSIGACFMYSRKVYETIGEYNPELELVEDIDYWQRIIACFNSDYISEILYDYRLHSSSLTCTMNKKKFYLNLKTMILKNYPMYKNNDVLDKYYVFKSLSICNKELNQKHIHYLILFYFYRLINFAKNRLNK